MAKKTSKSKGQKVSPSRKRAGAGLASAKGAKGGRRKTAGAKTPKGKARRKRATNPPRPGKLKKARPAASPARGRKTAGAKPRGTVRTAARKTARATSRRKASSAARKSAAPRRGGAGREETLAQTPETGRTRRGPTNPMGTRRSTGTPAGAGTSRAPRLDRARRTLREVEESVPGAPSSLDIDRRSPSAARSGGAHLQQMRGDHHETSPVMTGGDVDASWEDAYAVGDEAPGGDNPTPDQDRVDDIGKALGVEYQDNEELKASDKIAERDRHRWELDPASSEDYRDRD
jgi:hypothetical protein